MITLVQKSLKKLPPFKKFIVACSGGVDSVVLAFILKELGYTVILAHVNHQLRGKASDEDEVFVRDLAEKWNLEIEIKRSKIPGKGNLENNGRKARYAFLESVRQKHNADFIALAHHRDDQLETVLMHAMRGAGLRGLRGMQLQSDHLIRPFLEVSKKEIQDYAQKNQLSYRVDRSNDDLSFARNRWRKLAIPYLKKHFPDFEKKLLAMSRTAAKKLDRLILEAKSWLGENLKEDYFDSQRFVELKEDLRGEIIIQMLGPTDLYQNDVQKIIQLIGGNRSGAKAVVKNQCVLVSHNKVYFKPEETKENPLKKIEMIKQKECQWGNWRLINRSSQRLFVRSWKQGDRFIPSGMCGSKKLQDFFVNAKIPVHQRKKIPVIVSEKDVIMAVANYRVAQGAEELKTKLLIQKQKTHEIL